MGESLPLRSRPATRARGDRPVVLVTGATGGMGRAIAIELAARRARLVLAGRDRRRMMRLRREIGTPDARLLVFDLIDADAIEKAVDEVGPIDVLIHAAGVYLSTPPAQLTAEDAGQLQAVHVTGPARLTEGLLPALRQRLGQIVFVNSSVLDRVSPGVEAYAAAKFAQRAYAANLRQAVNANGMRVLVVHAGRTATAMQEAIHSAEGLRYEPDRLVQPSDIARIVADTLEAPRTVEITDIHLRPALPPRRLSRLRSSGET